MLVCRTKKEAAQQAGVGTTSLQRWMKEDQEFIQAYRDGCREMTRDAARQAQIAVSEAVETIEEIMQDKTAQAYARISAARAVLEFATKLTEQCDIMEQLQELEHWKTTTENGGT